MRSSLSFEGNSHRYGVLDPEYPYHPRTGDPGGKEKGLCLGQYRFVPHAALFEYLVELKGSSRSSGIENDDLTFRDEL